MASIRVKRTREYINGMKDYDVIIDGQLVGSVGNGKSAVFPVSVGRHTVRAKIDWCCSPEIPVDVNEFQTKCLKVGGFKYSRILMPIALGLLALHILLFWLTDIDFVIYYVSPIVLLLFYYTTFGKEKYLTISEIDGQVRCE